MAVSKSEVSQSSVSQWITFIGFLLLLLGIYGSIRTIINLTAFDKYPSQGAINLNIFNQSPIYYQREEDCEAPVPYYPDPMMEETSQEEQQKRQEQDKQFCLQSVQKERESAKINDISQSSLFLFLGLGILLTRKFLPKYL